MNMIRNKITGFSLIELMIVVAIIGILASVVLPNYSQYVQRGNRTDALTPMQNILVAQERFFTDNQTYTDQLADLGFVTPVTSGDYTITAQLCGDEPSNPTLVQCIELLATPGGAQADDGNIVMNSMGRRERFDINNNVWVEL